MEKIKNFFNSRDNIKNIILVIELILIIFLCIKCFNLEKEINEYKDQENNMIVQKVELPDIEIKEEATTPQSNIIDNNSNNIKTEETTNVDDSVLNSLSDLEKEIDSTSLKDKAKEKFITIVDFIFYDGKINGYTFNDLSDSTKLKVIELLINIDKKLEIRFPNYKEEIKDNSNKTYNNIKEKAVALYLDTTTKICNEVGDNTCNEAKNGFSDMKASFKLTWDNIKNMFKYATGSIEDWYKIYKNN